MAPLIRESRIMSYGAPYLNYADKKESFFFFCKVDSMINFKTSKRYFLYLILD